MNDYDLFLLSWEVKFTGSDHLLPPQAAVQQSLKKKEKQFYYPCILDIDVK